MSLYLLVAAGALLVLLLGLGRVPLRYNLRNLMVRWRTTLVTALAFTLVIALLTVMLAFVNGMYRLTRNSGHPCNVLVLSDGAPDEAISNLNVADMAEIEYLDDVLKEDGRPLASRETYLVVNQPVANPRPGRPPRRFLQLRGLTDPRRAARVHDLRLLPGGNWFSEAGVEELPADAEHPGGRTAIQAVLGEGVAIELGRDRAPAELARARNPRRLDVGDTFVLGNRTWIVTGILDSAGSTFNSEIWTRRSLLGPIFGKDTYTTLVLRTPSPEAARRLRAYLSGGNANTDAASDKPTLSEGPRYKKAAVAAHVETDYYAELSQTNRQFLYAIVFVATIMSVGGVFGVMNTMFAAVSQRVKDIGVLRLLGYRRRQILVSFLLESLAIALAGGLIGCVLGSLSDGWSATSVVSSGAGIGKTVALTLVVDADIIAVGVLLTLGMGLAGGVVPALVAMRLSPLEALR
jgi:cell division protein FtsX